MSYKTDRYKIDQDEEAIITDKHLDNAIISFLCGLAIAAAILGSLCARGCRPEPAVPPYSICEQCGEVISSADHGACTADVVVFNKAIRQ